jgi:hypothetical protein
LQRRHQIIFIGGKHHSTFFDVDESADPKQRFDRLPTGLLAVKKAEFQSIGRRWIS